MEFNEKLKSLRMRFGLTQQQLADKLFVSRTAISKWESGRGYPSIDSLKQIATFFSVSVDELISPREAVEIASVNEKLVKGYFCDIVFAFSDILAVLFIFLPLFAQKNGELVNSVSLLTITCAAYLKITYLAIVIASIVFGVATLAMQNVFGKYWLKCKRIISLALGSAALLIFTLTLNPYAAVLAFALLSLKISALIKR